MLFNMFPVHSGGCSINADTTFFNVLELVPELNVARLDLVELFGRHAPLQVDLGCGDGSFLCELAGQFPEKNFLGIERLTKRVEKVRRKALKIENVRVLGTDALFAVHYLLPGNSVETFYLFFPDPWPKRREQKRRIIRPEALTEMRRVLVDGGSGIYVTDHREYFDAAAPLIAQFFRSETRIPGPSDPPRTNYEAKYRAEGREIYEVRFWKTRNVEC